MISHLVSQLAACQAQGFSDLQRKNLYNQQAIACQLRMIGALGAGLYNPRIIDVMEEELKDYLRDWDK